VSALELPLSLIECHDTRVEQLALHNLVILLSVSSQLVEKKNNDRAPIGGRDIVIN
jgi:hypothetical protein